MDGSFKPACACNKAFITNVCDCKKASLSIILSNCCKIGTVFSVERENEFDAICATTATIASYFAFNETIASWLEQQGVPASQARDYIARLFLGVTTGAVEASERSFQSLAATHATAGGINEQFLKYLIEHGLLARVSEALDAVLRRIGVES